MSEYDLNAYFCHPWRSHVAVNLAIWQAMASDCNLIIDRPIIFDGTNPPFFVNRIESLFQQSDIFVGCLPFQPQATAPSGLQCSPWALFEVRMAERIGLPRCVFYDPRTRFQPTGNIGIDSRYIPCRLDELSNQLGANARLPFVDSFGNWLSWITKSKRPKVERTSFEAGLLLGSANPYMRGAIETGLLGAGFGSPVDLRSEPCCDSDLLESLRALRLLVVDLSDPEVLPIYHLAHALSVPCLRLHTDNCNTRDDHLPPILRGHPVGYQEDIIRIEAGDAFVNNIRVRAKASAGEAHAIIDPALGNAEIQRRGYVKHFVFISHDLKGENRAVIDSLVEGFVDHGVEFFEYETSNRAGEDWRQRMDDALTKMTHFVAIQSPTYDQSIACTQEMNRALERKSSCKTEDKIEIRAFRLYNRGSPSVILRDQSSTHQPLPTKPEAAAKLVVENILSGIRRKP